ncbi:MAG: ComEA family DNA-binding protein [Marinifilaceae bacterium]
MRKHGIIYILLVFGALSTPCITLSQNRIPLAIENLLEQMGQEENAQQDFTSFLEDLNFILSNPLDLNKVNHDDLTKLQILSRHQIQNLLNYREKYGPFLSIHELNLIPGFSHELTKSLVPFVKVSFGSDSVPTKPIRSKAKQLLLLRTQRTLEKQEGYQNYSPEDFSNPESYLSKINSRFLGNPYLYYTRYNYQSRNRNLQFGITAEKDPGEAFFSHKQGSGFDYYSAHLQWKGEGLLQQINLGDYQVSFGQGLCFWSGFSGNKSSLVIQNAKQARGIRKYSSTNENQYLRGAAIRLALGKKIQLSLFGSYKNRDANILPADSLSDTPEMASSLPTDGFHRNHNENQKQHTLIKSLEGGNLQYNGNLFEVGATFVRYQFSKPLSEKGQCYNLYKFSGNSNFNASIHYQFLINKFHLYGEIAQSQSGGIAILQGMQVQAHDQIAFEMIYRNYQKNHQAIYASAFSESGSPQNEEGIYLGTEIHPFPKWKISTYFDLYQFPWLRYRANAPGYGNDFFSQIHFQASDKFLLYFRYKREGKPENETLETGIDTPVEVTKSQYRIHFSYQIHPSIELRNRLEISNYQKADLRESGHLLYQDIILRPHNHWLAIQFRFALFDTDSYLSRIYTYENDLLYTFSVPSYFNKGIRTYLNIRIRVNRFARLYLKAAQTKYANTEKIGSGLTEIQGNTKTEVKAQLQIKF